LYLEGGKKMKKRVPISDEQALQASKDVKTWRDMCKRAEELGVSPHGLRGAIIRLTDPDKYAQKRKKPHKATWLENFHDITRDMQTRGYGNNYGRYRDDMAKRNPPVAPDGED
jgi:hypothetical protein